MKEFTLTAADGFPVSCALFESSGSPDHSRPASGIVQIIHGAKERKEIYYEFASFLASAGFHVILFDLRGHGASINDEYPIGHMGSWQILVSDIAMISKYVKNLFSGDSGTLPLTWFAHSFGSVLARCCLQHNGKLPDKLIMTGTTKCQPHAGFIVPVSKGFTQLLGEKNPAGFPLRYGEPASAVMKYSNGSVLTIWEANLSMQRTDRIAVNPALSILSLTCSDDRSTGGEPGLKKIEQFLYSQGCRNMRHIIYSESGHQPVFSGAREQALRDIISFLND